MPGSYIVFLADAMPLRCDVKDTLCSVRTELEKTGQQILSFEDKVFCLI